MKRIKTYDILKGIGIILVIIGHIKCNNLYFLSHFIYSFHMPLFFIISGIFFNPYKDNTINKYFKQLIIPYLFTIGMLIIWGSAIDIKNIFLHNYNHYSFSINYLYSGLYCTTRPILEMKPIGAIWFLPALFWCRIFYLLINKSMHKWALVIIISSLSVFISNYIDFPFCILQGCSALIFYHLGVSITQKKYIKFENKNLTITPYHNYMDILSFQIIYGHVNMFLQINMDN